MYKIMLVDDEENIVKSLKRVLRSQKEWEIETYLNAEDALKRARTCIFDVIISDYHMPDIDGIQFLCELKELQPDAMRILLTGTNESSAVLDAINEAGAYKFVTKPWDNEILLNHIVSALKIRHETISKRFMAENYQLEKSDKKNEKHDLGSAFLSEYEAIELDSYLDELFPN